MCAAGVLWCVGGRSVRDVTGLKFRRRSSELSSRASTLRPCDQPTAKSLFWTGSSTAHYMTKNDLINCTQTAFIGLSWGKVKTIYFSVFNFFMYIGCSCLFKPTKSFRLFFTRRQLDRKNVNDSEIQLSRQTNASMKAARPERVHSLRPPTQDQMLRLILSAQRDVEAIRAGHDEAQRTNTLVNVARWEMRGILRFCEALCRRDADGKGCSKSALKLASSTMPALCVDCQFAECRCTSPVLTLSSPTAVVRVLLHFMRVRRL